MRRVVVGVGDCPESSEPDAEPESSLVFAVEEAARRSLPLEVVHAVDLETSGGLDDAEHRLAATVERALDRVPRGRSVARRLVVLEGPPADCLLSRVPSAAMVVVGTRGGGALRRGARGSVSAAVLHRSWAPVVVVPLGSPTVANRYLSSRVVVAVDGSPPSLAALQWGVAQAREWECELTPVVVSAVGGRVPAALASEHDLTGAVARAVRECGGQSLDVCPHFLTGAPAPALLSFVTPEDLLVTGSRGRGGAATLLLGGTSTALAEHARCPVAVVREGQVRREVHQRLRRFQVGA